MKSSSAGWWRCKRRWALARFASAWAYFGLICAARLKSARESGCDLVLPRSAFVEQLPEDLPAWLTPRTTQ
jgi:hypothetical protein